MNHDKTEMAYRTTVLTGSLLFITSMLVFAMLAFHSDGTLDKKWNTIKFHYSSLYSLFLWFFKKNSLLVNCAHWENTRIYNKI
jgi:hypothetical protein